MGGNNGWFTLGINCQNLLFLKTSMLIPEYGNEGTSQAYTSKMRILIQVLPVPNAYTKSGDAYIDSCHEKIEQKDLA